MKRLLDLLVVDCFAWLRASCECLRITFQRPKSPLKSSRLELRSKLVMSTFLLPNASTINFHFSSLLRPPWASKQMDTLSETHKRMGRDSTVNWPTFRRLNLRKAYFRELALCWRPRKGYLSLEALNGGRPKYLLSLYKCANIETGILIYSPSSFEIPTRIGDSQNISAQTRQDNPFWERCRKRPN